MIINPIQDFEKITIFEIFKVIRGKIAIFDPEDGGMTLSRKSETHQITQRYTL
jgi:hypothetical protein